MKILFVVNNLYTTGNGLSASVRRTMEQLQRRGHEVRALTGADASGKQTPDYPLEDYHMPVFDRLIRKQGYQFAKSDRDRIQAAVAWADVIHLEEPFVIQKKTVEEAERQGVPCVATYHLHPENLFASVHLDKSKLLVNTLMKWWRDYVFDHCAIVTCPSQNAADRLQQYHFHSELRVITNGMPESSLQLDLPQVEKDADCFHLLTIGRFSVEKDQMTLLKAMKYSKYCDQICLYFAGRGPIEQKLRREADKLLQKGILRHPVSFGYYPFERLRELYAIADLYIHCATIEVEGLSCMEAIQTGIVPIISAGDLSATQQFAFSEQSRYAEQDPRDLAAKIDYWLAHETERRREAAKYRGLGEQYAIKKSIDQLEQVYADACKRRA